MDLAQEDLRRKTLAGTTTFGSVAPIAQSGNRGHTAIIKKGKGRVLFWQLVSVCRATPALKQLLEEPDWAVYLTWFKDFKQHVKRQNREILDAVLPEQLVLSAMKLCEYRFSIRHGVLYQCRDKSEDSMSSVDAYGRYGAEVIEEVLEKGSFRLSSTSR